MAHMIHKIQSQCRRKYRTELPSSVQISYLALFMEASNNVHILRKPEIIKIEAHDSRTPHDELDEGLFRHQYRKEPV